MYLGGVCFVCVLCVRNRVGRVSEFCGTLNGLWPIDFCCVVCYFKVYFAQEKKSSKKNIFEIFVGEVNTKSFCAVCEL